MKSNEQPVIRLAGHLEKWEWKKLNEISTKVTEKNTDNVYLETLTNSAEFGIVSQRDFFEKDISNKKNLNSYYVVRPDDFVYNPRISNFAPVGPIKRNKLNRTGVMSPLYYVFRTKEVDNAYLERYFSSESWHLFMKLNGDSGARSDRFAIKDVVFGEMPIPIPSSEEQTKIGEFFTQLDETIFLHQQEFDTLKQTKKGFLGKMFPKEGKYLPEFRFPGFTEKWSKLKFAGILNKQDGIRRGPFGSALKKEFFVKLSDYVVYEQRNAIYDNYETRYYITKEKFEELNRFKLSEGDFILSGAGTIGRISRVPKNIKQGVFNQALIRFKIDENIMDSEYFLQWIRAENMQRKLTGANPGSAMSNLVPMSEVKNWDITVPPKIEQIQIGNFFKQLDDVIALHQQELEALKQTRKAFLQKMFV